MRNSLAWFSLLACISVSLLAGGVYILHARLSYSRTGNKRTASLCCPNSFPGFSTFFFYTILQWRKKIIIIGESWWEEKRGNYDDEEKLSKIRTMSLYFVLWGWGRVITLNPVGWLFLLSERLVTWRKYHLSFFKENKTHIPFWMVFLSFSLDGNNLPTRN